MAKVAQTKNETQKEVITTKETENKAEIPMPAPVKETIKMEEEDGVVAQRSTEFELTTSLDMYEVKEDIRVRDALFNARDKHFLADNLCIFFARGKIDNWCAYIAQKDIDGRWHLYAPKDKFYFERVYYVAYMQSKAYPKRKISAYQKLYNEILHIAEIMFSNPTKVDDTICAEIDRIANRYGDEEESYRSMLRLALYEIYYGMIAEENKENTILGRKIKMLGLYDMLIEQKVIDVACDCNRKQPVGVIHNECNNIGFAWLAANDDENI